jgi:hypothetical protein
VYLRDVSSAEREGFVAVDVGTRCRRFYVHKALLMEHSEFFKKALQGTWKEATDGIVILEDIKPAIFDIFVGWLHTGEIPEEKDDEESDNVENDKDDIKDGEHEDQDDEYSDDEDGLCKWRESCSYMCGCSEAYVTSLVKAYTLGDRFLAPRYKHAVLDQLIVHMSDYIEPTWFRAIAHAYNNLPENDPMLRALVDIHCRYWTAVVGLDLSKEKKEQAGLVPIDFWLWTSSVLADKLLESPSEFLTQPLNPCDYHYHHRRDSQEERKCWFDWATRDGTTESINQALLRHARPNMRASR